MKIYRSWSERWEDAQYGEEVEVANILCHYCAGLDIKSMTKKDFDALVVDCYKEIMRKVGIVAGTVPLPVFNNKEYCLFGAIDEYDKGKLWIYVCKSEKRVEYAYTGESIYED